MIPECRQISPHSTKEHLRFWGGPGAEESLDACLVNAERWKTDGVGRMDQDTAAQVQPHRWAQPACKDHLLVAKAQKKKSWHLRSPMIDVSLGTQTDAAVAQSPVLQCVIHNDQDLGDK